MTVKSSPAFALMLVLLVMVFGCSTEVAKPGSATATDSVTGIVTVEIIQDEDTQTFQVDNVAAGATVESVMRKVDGIEVSISGSGNLAFLEQIGDQATQNGEGWTYTIDGERVERGIGASKLTPPATITWTYGDY